MPLRSNLFRSDSAFQNCLVLDSAHVMTGASGPHVARIQQALNIVNRARIADQEIIDSSFGSSTADEVLRYKTDRAIINRSYQAKPDNVVGKMTIASLDEEMVRSESHRVRDCCTDPSLGGSTSPGRASRFTATSVGGEPVQRKFPGILSVFMQPALVKGNMGPQTMNIVRDMPKRAKELLSPFALDLRSIANFSFHFPYKIKFDQEDESDRLREAAEGTLPGFDQTLRVLIAPFRRNDAGDDDVTTNGFSRSSDNSTGLWFLTRISFVQIAVRYCTK